jgi:hypothetical protein
VDFDLLRPHIRSVELKHKAVLVRTGEALADVYLPHNGIISLVVRLADGDTIEAAMVGRDSVFGASAALDGAIVERRDRSTADDARRPSVRPLASAWGRRGLRLGLSVTRCHRFLLQVGHLAAAIDLCGWRRSPRLFLRRT